MTSQKVKTLIVEDEVLLRTELSEALSETGDFDVVGEADSVDKAYDLIKTLDLDLVFMDIKIIGGLSFQIISKLKKEEFPIPPIVINTGFRDYEFAKKIHNEFGAEVIYILNKPFWENWVSHQEKILDNYVTFKRKKNIEQISISKYLTIQSGRKSYLINPLDIIVLKTGEKTKGNSSLIFEKQNIDSGMSMIQLMQKMPEYIRQVNRFEAINLNWISYIDHSEKEVVLRNGTNLSIGESYFDSLLECLTNQKS